jgi:HIP---CoA ligase
VHSPTTVPAVLADAARRFADAEALVDGDDRLTFVQLAEAANTASRAFVSAGLESGDRVAIWAPNINEWVIAALGVHGAGGVIVTLNTRFKGLEAADIIERSRARFLLCVNGFLGNDFVTMLRSTGRDLPDLERVIVLRGDVDDDTTTTSWCDFLAAARLDAVLPDVDEDDLSDIMFTSGTTGRPKGVMTTHGQTVRAFAEWSSIVGLTNTDRYLIVNPFFHTFGYKAGIVACLIRGATMIPHAVFDVAEVLQRVSDERISMLPGPPTIYQSILNHPDRNAFDLSSLRLAVTGAAAVPVALIRRMREELTFTTIITGYGLTESTGVIAMCRADDNPHTVATTSGRVIADVEMRIVDDDNDEVERGTPGEIVCRGYNVMLGYFEDPEATADAIDPDGWLHTGDIGVINDAGYVAITDRKKDMFIVGGFNAYPAEIEAQILEHPAVAAVAVVGVTDERMGEVGHAFVVARMGMATDHLADELMAWSRERMANYKAPRAVHLIEALPLNAAGKVLKLELRAAALVD